MFATAALPLVKLYIDELYVDLLTTTAGQIEISSFVNL